MIILNNRMYRDNNFYMASAADFGKDYGAAAGAPPKGTNRQIRLSNLDFKSVDDTATSYVNAVLGTGTASYENWAFLCVSGTWNSISSATISHSTGTLGAGLSLYMIVTSGFRAPSRTNLGTTSGINVTIPSGAAFGQPLYWNPIGPEFNGATGTISTFFTGLYSCYFPIQLAASADGTCSPGDTSSVTVSVVFTES